NEAFRSDAPSENFLLATSAAQFSELLKQGFWARGLSLRDLAGTAVPHLAENQDRAVRELATLIAHLFRRRLRRRQELEQHLAKTSARRGACLASGDEETNCGCGVL